MSWDCCFNCMNCYQDDQFVLYQDGIYQDDLDYTTSSGTTYKAKEFACKRLHREKSAYDKRFNTVVARTEYITQNIFPKVVASLQPPNKEEENKLLRRLKTMHDFDVFLQRLEIVLAGVSTWDDKLAVFRMLRCCHIPIEELRSINFSKLTPAEGRGVVYTDVCGLPERYYVNHASYLKYQAARSADYCEYQQHSSQEDDYYLQSLALIN